MDLINHYIFKTLKNNKHEKDFFRGSIVCYSPMGDASCLGFCAVSGHYR